VEINVSKGDAASIFMVIVSFYPLCPKPEYNNMNIQKLKNP
jgi:hypothetical protein